MASGGSSKGSGSGDSTSQNVGTAFLANLFGVPADFNAQGVQFGSTGGPPPVVPTGGFGGPTGGGTFGSGFGGPAFTPSTFGGSGGGAGGGVSIPGGFDPGGGFGAGGVALTERALGSQFPITTPAFAPTDFLGLRNILDPVPTNVFQAEGPAAGLAAFDLFPDTLAGFRDSVVPAAREALDTGFRTDLAPIIAEEQRRFRQETIPELSEQFAGLTGGFSTDFGQAVVGAGEDLGVQLGALQTQADEQAAQRRQEALTLGPQALDAAQTFPTTTASNLLGLGSQVQEDQFLARPEQQLIRSLTSLFNLAAPTVGSTQAQRNSAKNAGVLS